MELNNHYNKKLKTFARQNRNDATKAEACLWKYALKGKLTGYQFNRQRPVLIYIADFICLELKLIIEVDGYTHTFEEVQKKDVIRQARLEQAGFRVIRFKDEEVLREIGTVKETILRVIEEINRGSGVPLSPYGQPLQERDNQGAPSLLLVESK